MLIMFIIFSPGHASKCHNTVDCDEMLYQDMLCLEMCENESSFIRGQIFFILDGSQDLSWLYTTAKPVRL